jgi:hypothetical protein
LEKSEGKNNDRFHGTEVPEKQNLVKWFGVGTGNRAKSHHKIYLSLKVKPTLIVL